MKSRFKGTIKWNKYRSENQIYFIDATFKKVNSLFVLSFGNEDDRESISEYYTPKVEIEDFNVLVDGKNCF